MVLLDSALCKLQFSAKAAVENARLIISRVSILGTFSSKKMRIGELWETVRGLLLLFDFGEQDDALTLRARLKRDCRDVANGGMHEQNKYNYSKGTVHFF